MKQKLKPNSSVKSQYDLTGKNVLITGGAGFLGRHFASAVAEMGASPILLDMAEDHLLEAKKELAENNVEVKTYLLNICDKKNIQNVVNEIVYKHSSIDVLINSAAFAMKNLQEGGDGFFADFEDYSQKFWQVSLDVNLTGTFLMLQAVGKVMKSQHRGVIINIASDVAVISPDHRIYKADERFDYDGVEFNTPIGYSATKAGILAMTRYLSTYWAEDGIRVNSFSPAGVYRDQDPKFVEQLSSRIPLGRMAFAEEYKGPIVFLASDASSFMTGSNLIVDGGRTAW
jgi:NAD(P)-dependent dehydrogenase (short-subunit alcohol dehydrogenase family)